MDELSEMRNLQELHIPSMDHRSHRSAGGGMAGGKLAHAVETCWFGGVPEAYDGIEENHPRICLE